MAVVEATYAAVAPWAVTDVCSRLQSAFTDAGLMTAWFASFASGGREHRILEIVYDAAKTYGKTYYWFTVDSTGIYVRTSTGWNTSTNIPRGAGGAVGTQFVDWGDTDTTTLNYAHLLLAIQSTISFTVTRYSSGGRSFFLFRTGTTYRTFTIDPGGTAFKLFYDFAKGYHSGIFSVDAITRRVRIQSLHRNRRELFLGSCLNGGASNAQAVTVCVFCVPVSFGSTGFPVFPDEGFALPGWTTASNPSAVSNFNPVAKGLRLTSVHDADMPDDFGVASIKISNILAIQDNAIVTNGTEEYKIGAFSNTGEAGGITSNPAFLFRMV